MKMSMLLFLFIAFSFSPLYGHGTGYEILYPESLRIRTFYDTGEPIADARVLVFAPGETEVSFETTTDGEGVFSFTPDKPGTWIFQVRDATGHGMRINLDVGTDPAAGNQAGTGSIGYVQKIIMALCVVWGFIGRALFLWRRRKDRCI